MALVDPASARGMAAVAIQVEGTDKVKGFRESALSRSLLNT
jgi:hypothetical protein